MFRHAGRRDPVRCVMRCHDLHARGAYPVTCSGMGSGYSIRFPRLRVFGMACPFDPSSFRPSRRRLPQRRDPDSRVSCARLCRRGRAYRGGAARAPDCARETEGAPLPLVSQGFFRAGAKWEKKRPRADTASPLPPHMGADIRCSRSLKELNLFLFVFDSHMPRFPGLRWVDPPASHRAAALSATMANRGDKRRNPG